MASKKKEEKEIEETKKINRVLQEYKEKQKKDNQDVKFLAVGNKIIGIIKDGEFTKF